jgi:hypothetical protein
MGTVEQSINARPIDRHPKLTDFASLHGADLTHEPQAKPTRPWIEKFVIAGLVAVELISGILTSSGSPWLTRLEKRRR